MSSDKVTVNRNNATRSFDWRQWCWRALGIGLLLFGMPVGCRMWLHHRQESSLTAARELLKRVLVEKSSSQQTTLLEEAIVELRKCPFRDGSAELLSAAAERALIPNAPLPQEFRRAEEIRTIDLCLAAEIYLHTTNLGISNHLVTLALQRSDDRVETLRVAVLIGTKLGHEDQVLEYCKELSELAPNDPQPWQVVALIQEGRSLWPQAAEALSQLVKRAPQSPIARWRLANAWIETGEASKAREQVDQLPKDLGQDDGLRTLLEARLLYLEGHLEEALKLIDEFRKKQPEHPTGLLLHGRLLLTFRRLDEARQSLELLINVQPTSHEGHYTLGQVLSALGDRDAARQHLAIQRQLLDKKVELYSLERTAGRESKNREVRLELAEKYAEIGLPIVAEFWKKAAETLGPEQE